MNCQNCHQSRSTKERLLHTPFLRHCSPQCSFKLPIFSSLSIPTHCRLCCTKCAKEQSSLTHHDVGALHGHVEGRVIGGEALGATDEGGGRSRGEGIGRGGEGGNEDEDGLHLDGYNTNGGEMRWWPWHRHRASFVSTYVCSYVVNPFSAFPFSSVYQKLANPIFYDE